VTIEQLVDAAAAKGLMPAVVPEIHDFTIAGLINGLGIETSSHRYGGFHDIITAVELVLASGETLYVDEHTDKELFDCLPGSYGELGPRMFWRYFDADSQGRSVSW
jgi:Delta24-sterol reductase